MVLAVCIGMVGLSPLSAQADDALAYVGKHPLDKPLVESLAQNRVVFVGEAHDRYDHHLNQLAVLQALHQKNPNIAIGVEWFQQPFQAPLNDFLAGKISEAELLQRTEYYDRWGYDYRQLRPIMEYAKAEHLPVIALNAPVELTRKVSKGGLAALSTAERAQLPPTINPPDAAYRAELQKIFALHSNDKQQFENFLTVQRIWDETMAYQVVRYLQAHPQHQMLVLAGAGHTSKLAGIPVDVARQMPGVKLTTLASGEDTPPASVDHTLPSQDLILPPMGRLGLLLDAGANSLRVNALDTDSAAGKAGVQAGDTLASVDSVVIQRMADLKLVLAQRQIGDTVELGVKRKGTENALLYKVILQ